MKKAVIISLYIALAASSAHASGEALCREFTRDIQIGGKVQQGYGTACRQPDGSWKVRPDTTEEAAITPVSDRVIVVERDPFDDDFNDNDDYGYHNPRYYQPRPNNIFTLALGGRNDWDHGRRGHGYGNHGFRGRGHGYGGHRGGNCHRRW